jgi:hypothetical protein
VCCTMPGAQPAALVPHKAGAIVGPLWKRMPMSHLVW